MKPEILFRLILAKSLHNAAVNSCATDVDKNKFSVGLIGLHDAVDNFLGACVDEFRLDKGKGYLVDSLKAIEGHLANLQKKLIHKSEILKLNTLRNDIKHQGITPDIQTNKALVGNVEEFLTEYTKEFFSLDWRTVSLSELIRRDDLKKLIKTIERLIQEGKYKEAMRDIAIAKFVAFDESLLRLRCDPRRDLVVPSDETKKFRELSPVFPSRDLLSDFDHRLNLIEMSIDPRSFLVLEDYTAKVGFDNATDQNVVMEFNHNWCPPNWTYENAVYCLNLLVDLILKHQEGRAGLHLKNYRTEYQVRLLGTVRIFNKSGEQIAKIDAGDQTYRAIVFEYIDGQWQNFGSSFFLILSGSDGEKIGGYVEDEDKTKIQFLSSRYIEV